MKRLPFFLTLIGVCSLMPLNPLRAQAPAPSATIAPASSPAPTPDAAASFRKKAGQRLGAMFQNLSPEDRQKLLAARRAAMADPAVQSAQASGDKRAAHKAMRLAMLKDDPSVAPVLARIHAEAAQQKAGAAPGTAAAAASRQKPGAGGMENRLAFLPADERTKLLGASRTAQSDAQVTALRQQWTAAATPEAKAQAGKAYRLALRDAILREDPSLAPVIQKVQEHRAAEAEDMTF